jgi:hypothetical protein
LAALSTRDIATLHSEGKTKVVWLNANGGAIGDAMGGANGDANAPAAQLNAASMSPQQPYQESSPFTAPSATLERKTPLNTLIADALMARIESCASWFYWVAALTAIGFVMSLFGSNWRFAMGLDLVSFVLALTDESVFASVSTGMKLGAWAVSILLIGLFAWLGKATRKPSSGLFLLGIGVYALDALLSLLSGNIVGIAFHALALYFFYVGWKSAREYESLD